MAGEAMQEWHHAWALEALRVLKPGGHCLAFGRTRTHHRLMCALEDAGFEIRDTISYLYDRATPEAQFFQSLTPAQQQAYLELHHPGQGRLWMYGQGFPKSLAVGKALDQAAGVERDVIGKSGQGSGAQPHKLNAHGPGDTGIGYMDGSGKVFNVTAPATDAARQRAYRERKAASGAPKP